MLLRLTAPVLTHLHHKARRRVLFLAAWVVVYVAASRPAQAKTNPDGLGGLITVPDLAKGQPKTLLETYGPGRYEIFKDLGRTDLAGNAVYPIYGALNEVAYALTKLAVGLTWWLQSATTMSTGTDSIGSGIQSTAGAVTSWLLPTTMVLGAAIAYAKAKKAESALEQVVAVALIAAGVVGLSLYGKDAVAGVDNGRVQLSKLVNSAGVTSIAQQNEPFKFSKDPVLSAGTPYATERKAGDVVWRQFYVTPWCQLQFGSQAACKAYADKWLATSGYKAREDYLKGGIADAEEDDEAPTVEYIKGKMPGTRLGIALMTVLTAAGACIVIGGLAFFALLPWLLALVLMFLVVFFVCLMVIPGPLRDIGKDYLTTILGQIILSALMGGLLSGMLLLVIQASKMSATQGWVASMLITAAALGAGWQGRKIISQKLTGSANGGMGGGLLAGMMLSKMAGRMGRSMKAARAGRGASKSGGHGSSDSGSNGAGGRMESAAQRAGQVAGAVRHPGVAASRGMSSARGHFSARKQQASERRQSVKDAARTGYAQTGGRAEQNERSDAGSTPASRAGGNAASRQGAGYSREDRQARSDSHSEGRYARPSASGARRGEHGATSKNLPPRSVSTAGAAGRSGRPRPSRAGGGKRPMKPMRPRSTAGKGKGQANRAGAVPSRGREPAHVGARPSTPRASKPAGTVREPGTRSKAPATGAVRSTPKETTRPSGSRRAPAPGTTAPSPKAQPRPRRNPGDGSTPRKGNQ